MKLLPAVMVRAPIQQEKARIWLEHAKRLNSGYKIDILDAPISVELSKHKADAAFRFAMERYAGQPFLWIEPDSIPLEHNWLERITDEYSNGGKPFMLPYLDSIGDIGSGIGVYPGDSHWIIPQSFDVHAWDAWVYRNLRSKIHFSRLIQHSYGVYDGLYMERRHAFPKDNNMKKASAVLFHSDPMQSLARIHPRFYHTGDIGDVIAALAIIKHLGGGEIIIGKVDPELPKGKIPRGNLYDDSYDQLKPLLEMQDYVTNIHKLSTPAHVEGFDFSLFRLTDRRPNENLIQWQARAVGLGPIDELPWLKCGTYIPHERIVVARSNRYHNPFFPWRHIIEKYRNRILFVGTHEEYLSMLGLVNQPIEHAKTPTLLDLAKTIMGAQLVFANQSAPFWIAAGLGKPIVQECWLGGEMNAMVKHENIQYITTDLTKIAKLFNAPQHNP